MILSNSKLAYTIGDKIGGTAAVAAFSLIASVLCFGLPLFVLFGFRVTDYVFDKLEEIIYIESYHDILFFW